MRAVRVLLAILGACSAPEPTKAPDIDAGDAAPSRPVLAAPSGDPTMDVGTCIRSIPGLCRPYDVRRDAPYPVP